jgi:hypothetical protein
MKSDARVRAAEQRFEATILAGVETLCKEHLRRLPREVGRLSIEVSVAFNREDLDEPTNPWLSQPKRQPRAHFSVGVFIGIRDPGGAAHVQGNDGEVCAGQPHWAREVPLAEHVEAALADARKNAGG